MQTRRGGAACRAGIGDGNRFPGVLLGERAGRAAARNQDRGEARRTRPGVPDRRSTGAAERTGVASPAARETGLDQIPGRLVGHRHELPGGELRTRATRGPVADGEAHGASSVHLQHPGLGFPVRPRPTGLVAPEPGHGRRNPTDRGPGIPGRGGRIRTGQDLAGRRSPRRRIATARDVRGPGAGAPGQSTIPDRGTGPRGGGAGTGRPVASAPTGRDGTRRDPRVVQPEPDGHDPSPGRRAVPADVSPGAGAERTRPTGHVGPGRPPTPGTDPRSDPRTRPPDAARMGFQVCSGGNHRRCRVSSPGGGVLPGPGGRANPRGGCAPVGRGLPEPAGTALATTESECDGDPGRCGKVRHRDPAPPGGGGSHRHPPRRDPRVLACHRGSRGFGRRGGHRRQRLVQPPRPGHRRRPRRALRTALPGARRGR